MASKVEIIDDIDWLECEFNSFSQMAQSEFACSFEEGESYSSGRERASAIFDRLRAMIAAAQEDV